MWHSHTHGGRGDKYTCGGAMVTRSAHRPIFPYILFMLIESFHDWNGIASFKLNFSSFLHVKSAIIQSFLRMGWCGRIRSSKKQQQETRRFDNDVLIHQFHGINIRKRISSTILCCFSDAGNFNFRWRHGQCGSFVTCSKRCWSVWMGWSAGKY